MNFIWWSLIIIGGIFIIDIILVAAWMALITIGTKRLEKQNPLHAVNNHFASNDAIRNEEMAIQRARNLTK